MRSRVARVNVYRTARSTWLDAGRTARLWLVAGTPCHAFAAALLLASASELTATDHANTCPTPRTSTALGPCQKRRSRTVTRP